MDERSRNDITTETRERAAAIYPPVSAEQQYKDIPAELKAMRQWVCFKLEPDEKKPEKINKMPYNPRTGYRAKANDPGTWADYKVAIAAYNAGGYDGIGFEFANNVFGVDLDHVISPDGAIDPAAQDIIDTLDSYTELSPSGTGVHILCKGEIPPDGNRAGFTEIYSGGRFFTVTGRTYGPLKRLEERTAQAAVVHAKYIKKREQPPVVPSITESSNKQPARTQDDNSVLQLAFNSLNGAQIKALYGGDITAHNGLDRSQTGADLALCGHLVYWANGDRAQVDRLFRGSALMRAKWDEMRGKKTYGEKTLDKALEGFTPYMAQEYNVNIGSSPGASSSAEKPSPPSVDPLEAAAAYQQESAAGYVDQFFNGVADSVNTPAIPTGFTGLDKMLEGGLYEGLYIIGAISSLGKTTFVLQMADQIAEAGHDVIIFSLEMARSELMAKSISRLTFKLTQQRKNAKTTRGITTGKRYAMYSDTEMQLITKAREEYREKISPRVWIREGMGDLGVEQIRAAVERHINLTGRKPVVMIDYLQILAPYDMRATDKQNTDKAVLELKRISRDHKIPVFGISSFNRDNYTAPVNMASFKESGAIEYSSDVLMGLQYEGMDYSEGEADGARQKRIRQLIKDNEETARKGEGVQIHLKILKNRNGSKGSSDPLTFYPMFNIFQEYPEGFTAVKNEKERWV